MANPEIPQKVPSSSALRIAVVGSALLLVAAGAAFFYASRSAESKRQPHGDEIVVNILSQGCEPNALNVPAGKASFRIVNKSQRAVEWEILDGVMVVEERENIAPGLSQVINTKLAPGNFAITCGLLSNPRGSLVVTPTKESDAAAQAKPTLVAMIGPLSEYRVYLNSQSRALLQAIDDLKQAVANNNLPAAQTLYLNARADYQRIAPSAQRFAELDNHIAARADYLEKREQDAGFRGFHRIEYALFQQRDMSSLAPVIDTLRTDVEELKQQLLGQALPPEQLVTNVVRNLHSLAEQRLNGEEERYSHSDLNGFAANLEGAQKVIDLLQPLLVKNSSDVLQRLNAASASLKTTLQSLRTGDVYKSYDQVSAEQRQQIGAQAKALADALDAASVALGLTTP